jgi:hypothetical protein
VASSEAGPDGGDSDSENDPDSDAVDYIHSFVAQFRTETNDADVPVSARDTAAGDAASQAVPASGSFRGAAQSLQSSSGAKMSPDISDVTADIPCLTSGERDDGTGEETGSGTVDLMCAVLSPRDFSDNLVSEADLAADMDRIVNADCLDGPSALPSTSTQAASPDLPVQELEHTTPTCVAATSSPPTTVLEKSKVKAKTPVIHVLFSGRWTDILLSAALAMLRVNRRLSADRMIRMTQAMTQKSIMQQESITTDAWLVPSMYVCIRFESTMEIGDKS